MKKEFIIDLSGVEGLANKNLPDPSLLGYYQLLSERKIFINHDIDIDLVDYTHNIIKWNKEDKGIEISKRNPILVFINSNGGCLNSCQHFIDIVKLSKTPVYTIAMGKIYSAGFLMTLAGHKRFCFDNSEGLLHSGSFGIMNSTEKVMDYIDHTRRVEKKVKEYVVSRTSISEELYDKNYRNEWYMTSEDMLGYGVIDEIITDLDIFL